MSARTELVLVLAAASLAPACTKAHHHAPPFDPFTYEIEPNDVYWTAQGLGPMAVGEGFLVRGSISEFGPDLYDGFALYAEAPMDVEFRLTSDDPNDDFDVALFDPYTLETIATWESANNPESGSFSVLGYGVEYHLVVSSYRGTGAYTFDIWGAPLGSYGVTAGATLAAQAPEGRRAIDWKGYGAARERQDEDLPLPFVPIVSYAFDPATGSLRALPVTTYLRLDRLQEGP